jgi:hypothetical protein
MADEPEDRSIRRCLPVVEWPDSDRAAWDAAHCRGGLLDEDGLAADWASATSSIIAGGYGRFLSFLAAIGELDPSASPAERITRPRIEAYVAHLRERNHSSTVAARILQLRGEQDHGPWRKLELAAAAPLAVAPDELASAR